MKSIKQAPAVKGKKVLVRVDFNVPLLNNKVVDSFRIRTALPTIQLLQKKGAKIILISHLGRDQKQSLKPVYTVLKKYIPVRFVPYLQGEQVVRAITEMKNGEILLLENLRSTSSEQKSDMHFAKELASYGDIFVNEAFPVSHRKDASIIGVPKFLPSYAGLQFEKEVTHLKKALSPKHPFLFILGGAKAETKLPLLKKYIASADAVFVGGVLANDFFRAQGFSVGDSKTDTGLSGLTSLLKNKKLLLPAEVMVLRKGVHSTISLCDIQARDKIVDIGVHAIDALTPLIQKAKLIVWNGPMGWYEGGNVKATHALLKLLAGAKGETIIGGGDTAVFVERKKMHDAFTFVSTGGGATLDFLTTGTLPGIKALK